MSGSGFQVLPLSRRQIRVVAKKVRDIAKELTGADEPTFPVLHFLDVLLPKHVPDFTLEILPEAEMGNAHGFSYPDRHLIQIREDVYERAHRGRGRDRMTMAHELGHYILHSGLVLARAPTSERTKPFRDSEWQANAFAGELLISADHIHTCAGFAEAALIFGVSSEAAHYQWRVFEREGIIKKRRR